MRVPALHAPVQGFPVPTYAGVTWRLSNGMRITPALDQQLGGLLMWIVGSIFFIVLASLFFLRWMLQQENADHVPLSTGLDEAGRAEQRGSRKPA